jgi:hypothetical protein
MFRANHRKTAHIHLDHQNEIEERDMVSYLSNQAKILI